SLPPPAPERPIGSGGDRSGQPADRNVSRPLAASAAAPYALAVDCHSAGRYRSAPTAHHAAPHTAPGVARSRAVARRMRIAPGTWVTIQGRRCCIREVVDLETVVVQDAETGATRHTKIQVLQPDGSTPETLTAAAVAELADIEDKDWQR